MSDDRKISLKELCLFCNDLNEYIINLEKRIEKLEKLEERK